MRNYLFNTDKLKYVKGDKPKVDCILCAIRDGNPEVKNFEVTRRDGFIISVNLYPFNPGHLIIFPARVKQVPNSQYRFIRSASLPLLFCRACSYSISASANFDIAES